MYRKFKFLFPSFFHLTKILYGKCKLLPSNQKTCPIESLTISKNVLHNFAEKLLARLICL